MNTIFECLYSRAEEYWLEAARDNFDDDMFDAFRSPVDLYLRKDGTLVDHSKLTFNEDYMGGIVDAYSSSRMLNMYCRGYDAFLEEPVDEYTLYNYLKEQAIEEYYVSNRFVISFNRFGGEDVYIYGDVPDLVDELSTRLVEEPWVFKYLDCSNMESLVNDVYDKLVLER